ncbi:RNA polymerase sigma factor [Pedobacter sp. SYSU D00535]|uniref:RNA polymerase sigma factor n=1 Tax=Pedobacter sp. SYSU D00535 TaxID=2810308 RepID=UPI001A956D30|nr:sigma-70 family RNA polymerase sigma factor [Pedobacter sp. SYSU D00535]
MKFIKHKNTSTATDADLLDQYKKTGDLEILGCLYERYMPLLYGLCLKYYKDEDKSKDAVMQIFEQLITKLRIHEVGNFKSWLYTLARNFCLMDLRSLQKHEFVNIEENGVEKPLFDHQENDELKEKQLSSMSKCMEKLPHEQRITIDLFYLQQKCYKEVAEITGFDANKVKSYIQNGKRNLKICMEKNRGNE